MTGMGVAVPASPGDPTGLPATPSARARAVAVISDGSADASAEMSAELAEPRGALGLVLRRYAALIRETAGLTTHVVTLETSTPAGFAGLFSAALAGVGDEVAAVFLPHTEPDRAAGTHRVGQHRDRIDRDVMHHPGRRRPYRRGQPGRDRRDGAPTHAGTAVSGGRGGRSHRVAG